MKILIPGGHLTPALAFIEYLKTSHPEVEVVFCGRLFSQDALKQVSQEKTEVTKRKVPFIFFQAPRWDHSSIYAKMLYPFYLLKAVFQALGLIWHHKPTIILSFGGYLAVPIALAGYLARIPIVTHEQTRSLGVATRLIGRFADKIALTYPETAVGLPASKTVLTGNPLRLGLFSPQPKPAWLPQELELPLIYITGGNQGSEIINSMIQRALRSVLKEWIVVHQCGNQTQRRRYKHELEQARRKLPTNLQNNYLIREWLTEEELGWLYQHASGVVSRAGANTVLELAAHHLPSILIPLPFAHGDEQTLNAKYLADRGGAILIPQKDLTLSSFLAALTRITKYQRSMSLKLQNLVVPNDAAAKLYQVLATIAKC